MIPLPPGKMSYSAYRSSRSGKPYPLENQQVDHDVGVCGLSEVGSSCEYRDMLCALRLLPAAASASAPAASAAAAGAAGGASGSAPRSSP